MDFTTISIPDFLVTDEAKAWFIGFGVMAFVRIFRTALRVFARATEE